MDLREEKEGYFTVADLNRFEVTNLGEAYQFL